MSGRAVILAAVGAGCIAAAGVGGFVATRMSAPAQGAAATPPVSAARPAASDALATPAPAATEPAPAEISRPAPVVSESPAAKRHGDAPKPQPAAPAPSTKPDTPAAVPTPPAESAPTPAPLPVSTPPVGTLLPPPPVDGPVVEAPKPHFEELTVTENSVIGIHLDSALSSDTARVEDKVTAHVSRDLVVSGHTAIPSGSRLEGNVTLVERGGKFKDRARLGIRFTTLVLADNTRQTIQTETIFRDGDSPTGEATSKVGASAAIGAILGAVIGGKKGAVIGSTAGAAGGTAAVAAGGRNDATFAAGTPLTVRLTAPLTILIERDPQR